jgi:hypothetical protein
VGPKERDERKEKVEGEVSEAQLDKKIEELAA